MPHIPGRADVHRAWLRAQRAGAMADAAVRALIDEAALAPKPGLADSLGGGAHADLSFDLMCRSAHALHPFLRAMARVGAQELELQALRERIGLLGREAEAAMMGATGGVNTHRGAIWALGLLVTAAGQDDDLRPAAVANRAGMLARCHDRGAPGRTGNKGEAARRRYGVGGATAQAQAGFPQVLRAALPQLRGSRRRGDSEAAARLNALLAVMAQLDDTCLLSRGGRRGLAGMQARAAVVLAAGGAGSSDGRRALQRLNDYALAYRLSPGGAADLLAAALFVDGLESRRDKTLAATVPGDCLSIRDGVRELKGGGMQGND
ncbi:triphosphoribosyl-dephospho-CoA synthase [Pusillimonas sp.]|uniref:triphosphoribosyl-dephospho-CoA synthase n=1 Tax=Pusillimonas sp. TaxID=3040095 RepID=UPI0039B86116